MLIFCWEVHKLKRSYIDKNVFFFIYSHTSTYKCKIFFLEFKNSNYLNFFTLVRTNLVFRNSNVNYKIFFSIWCYIFLKYTTLKNQLSCLVDLGIPNRCLHNISQFNVITILLFRTYIKCTSRFHVTDIRY